MTKPALSLSQIVFSRPSGFALSVDFSVEPGERVALMGSSGSGKSTIIDLVAGFELPHSGEVRFDGRDLTRSAPGERPVSTLFQADNWFGHLDVFSNVALGVSPSLRLTDVERGSIGLALEKVGLADKTNALPSQLSGGERQRVAIARMLVRRKPVLLLDEPFSSLGPALGASMLGLVRGVAIETRAAAVLITHDLDDASAFASRAIFMVGGKVAYDGPVADIRQGGGKAVDHYFGTRPR